jgi:hypothetical protein
MSPKHLNLGLIFTWLADTRVGVSIFHVCAPRELYGGPGTAVYASQCPDSDKTRSNGTVRVHMLSSPDCVKVLSLDSD